MPKKEKTEEAKKPQKTKVDYLPLDVPSVYVNHAQMSFSIFDSSIVVGEIAGTDRGTNTMNVLPRVKLIMSHRFLVEFAALLNRNLEAFKSDERFQAQIAEAPPVDVEIENESKDE